MIYLDTHVVAALDRADLRLYSRDACRMMGRASELRISPVVLMELEFLREIGRIRSATQGMIADLVSGAGLRICDRHFADVARQAAKEAWTRDPFDRIIVAQARLAKAALITRDGVMLKHYTKALS